MKTTFKIKALASAASVVAMTFGVTLCSTEAAHARSCWDERQLSSRVTTLENSAGGKMGDLYLGYLPLCREAYAEVHWTAGSNSFANSGSIWVEDATGAPAGKHYTGSNQLLDDTWWHSDPVSIGTGRGDGFGYYYMVPHVYADWTYKLLAGPSGIFPVPLCMTNHDWHGNYHNFYTGYNDSSHNSEGC